MKVSKCGYLFLFLEMVGVLLIDLFGDITINNGQDYYLINKAAELALIDSVDLTTYQEGIGYDGVTGEIRIVKEKFVESFVKYFSENIDGDKTYTITFNEIDECPPKVKVTVKTNESLSLITSFLGKKETTIVYETDTTDVTNTLSAILENEE